MNWVYFKISTSSNSIYVIYNSRAQRRKGAARALNNVVIYYQNVTKFLKLKLYFYQKISLMANKGHLSPHTRSSLRFDL